MRDLAKISIIDGPSQISRESGKRRLVIGVNVNGRDLGGFVKEAQDKIAKEVSLPNGYTLDWGGQFENMERAMETLSVIVPLTIAAMSAVGGVSSIHWNAGRNFGLSPGQIARRVLLPAILPRLLVGLLPLTRGSVRFDGQDAQAAQARGIDVGIDGGKRCFLGLDLASTVDVNALALLSKSMPITKSRSSRTWWARRRRG